MCRPIDRFAYRPAASDDSPRGSRTTRNLRDGRATTTSMIGPFWSTVRYA